MSLRAVGFGVCAALVLATQSWAATAPDDTAQSAANIKAHITFLASDLLLGRETGSPGHEIAANYAASQLAQLGLKPGGDGGSYFQHVPLVAFRPANQGSYVLHDKSGKATTLVFGEDYLVSRNPLASETRLSAQMVFVGYGIEDRDKRRNDYAGLNLKGKIAVVIGGAPASYQTEERAYYANGRTKRATAAAHGAIGLLTLSLPEDEKRYPFANAVRQWQSWGMSWRKADGTAFVVAPSVTSLGTISANGAAKLLDGLPVSLTQIADMADSKAANPPRFEIPGRLDVSFATEIKPLDSMNVVGVIPGTDPVLKDQVVVLSAHLDHLGVTAPVNGDSINNGAMDNAAGSATTLEVARKFMASGLPPKRTTLFLLTTGEEKGLIGAEYFARNPTVPLEQIVADVDLDMPILTYDFTDVIAFGSDRSGIGPAVQRAAKLISSPALVALGTEES